MRTYTLGDRKEWLIRGGAGSVAGGVLQTSSLCGVVGSRVKHKLDCKWSRYIIKSLSVISIIIIYRDCERPAYIIMLFESLNERNNSQGY